VPRSPSIYPDDPESAHYDPLVFTGRDVAEHTLQEAEASQIDHRDGAAAAPLRVDAPGPPAPLSVPQKTPSVPLED
jgi:hypothetical protein